MRRWVRWSVGIGIVGLGLLLAVFPLFDAAAVYLENAVMAGIMLGVASLGLVVLGVMLPRLMRRGVANARAFLQRTQPVAPQVPGKH